MNGHQIKQSFWIKYLGVTIEHKLKFNLHCKNVLQQARQTLAKLYVLLGYYSNRHKTNKIKIYKTCVRSLLTYNNHVWDDLSNSNMKKLESFQSKCLRQCLNLRRILLLTDMESLEWNYCQSVSTLHWCMIFLPFCICLMKNF